MFLTLRRTFFVPVVGSCQLLTSHKHTNTTVQQDCSCCLVALVALTCWVWLFGCCFAIRFLTLGVCLFRFWGTLTMAAAAAAAASLRVRVQLGHVVHAVPGPVAFAQPVARLQVACFRRAALLADVSPRRGVSVRSFSSFSFARSGASRPRVVAAVAGAGLVTGLATMTTACTQGGVPWPTTHLARLMLPDDANPAKNVHGGTILKMVDEAGSIAATRFANKGQEHPVVCALARMENMDFVRPMFIGEVAHLDAKVTFASEHSIETEVCVWAENPVSGSRRVTNKARCWYVATRIDHLTEPASPGHLKAVKVPPFTLLDADEQAAGAKRYAQQKEARTKDPGTREPFGPPTLVHLMLPGDCNAAGLAQAGVIMKLMDNVAGITAARHCRSNVVTVSLDSMDFYQPVRNGNVVSLHARPTFTSKKSMEIEVEVYAEDLRHGRRLTNKSNFVFVSLDETGKTQSIPPLKPKTEEEKVRFQDGYLRYVGRKTNPPTPMCCKLPED
eukprot:m.444769 g.444769  ORF g.444769 m.444769 type:complete len:502 (+) comp20300_c2_seq4:135-1640(+)